MHSGYCELLLWFFGWLFALGNIWASLCMFPPNVTMFRLDEEQDGQTCKLNGFLFSRDAFIGLSLKAGYFSG